MATDAEDPDDEQARKKLDKSNSGVTSTPPANKLKAPRARETWFWVKLAVSAVFVGMSALQLVSSRPRFRAGFTWLIVPLALGLEAASTRRYHQYRAGVQAVIQGRIDKQREAAEKAKAKDAAKAQDKEPAAKAAPPAAPGLGMVGLTLFEIAGNRVAPVDPPGNESKEEGS